MAKPRDYKKEYAEYQGTAQQKLNRAKRNAARAKMTKKVGAAALKGKDVDHIRGVGAGNGAGNLRVMSIKKNRGRK